MKKVIVIVLIVMQVGFVLGIRDNCDFINDDIQLMVSTSEVRSYTGVIKVVFSTLSNFLMELVELSCNIPQLPFHKKNTKKYSFENIFIFSLNEFSKNIAKVDNVEVQSFDFVVLDCLVLVSRYKILWLFWLFFLCLFRLKFCYYAPRGDILNNIFVSFRLGIKTLTAHFCEQLGFLFYMIFFL